MSIQCELWVLSPHFPWLSKGVWTVIMFSLLFLNYYLGDWLFFSNIRSSPIFDLHPSISFHWDSNYSCITYMVRSWTVVDDLGGQVVNYPSRKRSSLTTRFPKRFLAYAIWRAWERRNFLEILFLIKLFEVDSYSFSSCKSIESEFIWGDFT